MSAEKGRWGRIAITGAAVFLAFLAWKGSGEPLPAGAQPDAECGQIGPEVCVPNEAGQLEPMCPVLKVCPTSTTLVPDAPNTVEVATSSPATTPPVEPATVPPAPVGVEQAPAATDPPPDTAPSPTEAPAAEQQLPHSAPPATDPCPTNDWRSVRQGDTWVSLADRLDVWTKDLLAINGADKTTPLVVGAAVCRPQGPYDGQDAPSGTPAPTSPAAPATNAPQPPTTPSPTAPPIMPTAPPNTGTPAPAAPKPTAPAPTNPTSPPAPPNSGTKAPKPTAPTPPSTTRPRNPKPTYPRPPAAPSTTRPSVV